MFDIIIIGAGPAGLTAGIYASIVRKKVLILEKYVQGGQILKTNKVKNYPGFIEISGYDYATKLYEQATNLGVTILYEEAIKINNLDNIKEVITRNNKYEAKSIILAMGAENRKLNLENEDKLIGKGISYCATCDGIFYKDKIVAVYGGGNNAIDDALYLSNIAQEVYIIYRQKEFKFNSINLEALKNKNNVKFLLDNKINKLIGNDKLESIEIINSNNEKNIIDIDCLFVAIGHIPITNICDNLININDKGYIIAGEDCKTNVEGIFCAGDIRIKDVRQLTTACSDGTTAALNACKYIQKSNI